MEATTTRPVTTTRKKFSLVQKVANQNPTNLNYATIEDQHYTMADHSNKIQLYQQALTRLCYHFNTSIKVTTIS